MRIGNTTESAAPWSFHVDFSKFKPRKWQNPGLMYLHIGLKLMIFMFIAWGHFLPFVSWFGSHEGFLFKNDFPHELRIYTLTILVTIDYFVTKNIIGPRVTGLHHGFRRGEEKLIEYHFYAEKDFLTRYASADRDTFFTTLVLFSFIWLTAPFSALLVFHFDMVPVFFFTFLGVYLNLYLFVQTRYYRQWGMSKFLGTWLYNWIVSIKYLHEDSAPAGFRNGISCRSSY